jgi:hypothetical protein
LHLLHLSKKLETLKTASKGLFHENVFKCNQCFY